MLEPRNEEINAMKITAAKDATYPGKMKIK